MIAEAAIRLIGTIGIHCLLVGDAIKLFRDDDIQSVFENLTKQAFDKVVHVIRGDKRSFDINLSKLGLAVCSEIFISEAASNLEILFNATTHQQLLVLLWCLGECVKAAGLHA